LTNVLRGLCWLKAAKNRPNAFGKDCAIGSNRFVDKSVRGSMLNDDLGQDD